MYLLVCTKCRNDHQLSYKHQVECPGLTTACELCGNSTLCEKMVYAEAPSFSLAQATMVSALMGIMPAKSPHDRPDTQKQLEAARARIAELDREKDALAAHFKRELGRIVLKPWVRFLPLAMQGTLLTAIRGPDGVRKDHPIKLFLRAYRRSILVSAKPVPNDFMSDETILSNSELRRLYPPEQWAEKKDQVSVARLFSHHADDLPHHQLMHFIHCAEIVGYEHPDLFTRQFWSQVYVAACEAFHMTVEPHDTLGVRLQPSEGW